MTVVNIYSFLKPQKLIILNREVCILLSLSLTFPHVIKYSPQNMVFNTRLLFLNATKTLLLETLGSLCLKAPWRVTGWNSQVLSLLWVGKWALAD